MKQKKICEHICVVLLRDGHSYGASVPLTKSKAIEIIRDAENNNVEACGVDLNVLFDPEYGDLDFENNFLFDKDSISYLTHFSEGSD